MLYKIAQAVPIIAGYKDYNVLAYPWSLKKVVDTYEHYDEDSHLKETRQLEGYQAKGAGTDGVQHWAIPRGLRDSIWDFFHKYGDSASHDEGNYYVLDRKGLVAWAQLIGEISTAWELYVPDSPGERPRDPHMFTWDKEKAQRNIKDWERHKKVFDRETSQNRVKAVKELRAYQRRVLQLAKNRKYKSFEIHM